MDKGERLEWRGFRERRSRGRSFRETLHGEGLGGERPGREREV